MEPATIVAEGSSSFVPTPNALSVFPLGVSTPGTTPAWFAQSVAGRAAFNETRLQQLEDPLSWTEYLANADFWARTLQNWQSEFLAVGAMAVISIYLRQRGSPESKPVGEAHTRTGTEG